MVKSYLKFEQASAFGVVASGTSNLLWSAQQSGTGYGRAIVGANEDVLCWDIKKGELVSQWHDDENKAQVTATAQSHIDPDVVAVGYDDGSIRMWDGRLSTIIVKFDGHKSAVTHLAFDNTGVRLASGSRDTDVIVWDLVAETGLFKLRGHRDQITGLQFVEPSIHYGKKDGDSNNNDEEENALVVADAVAGEGFLLTTSKDSLIKLWDLSSRHCIETHVAHSNGECWALGVSEDLAGCITAGNDGQLQIWAIRAEALAESTLKVDMDATETFLVPRGLLHRTGKDRTVEIKFYPRRNYIAIHGVEKAVEIWRIRSDAEIKKALARKRRRRREKLAAKKAEAGNGGGDVDMADDGDEGEDVEEDVAEEAEDVNKADVTEIFVQHVIVRTSGRVRSAEWESKQNKRNTLQLLVSTTNNQLELFDISTRKDRASKKDSKKKDAEAPEYNRVVAVELPGHRTDIRSIALSSDDRMLATAANGSVKIWNVQTKTCIRTFESGYALCCAFLPGNKVVVVGTKAGELELHDVASASLLERIKAHEGDVWSLHVHPDGRSVVTGSADKTVKFWDFKITQETIPGTTQTTPKLHLAQTRLLKVADQVLSLKYSPDAKLLAVALLDRTVKVFFTDSLKLYLNLYGHKLPVLTLDISYDSKLIVTGSADKNVKIWGLDFGDCHKSIFAHQDSILQVAFVPNNSDGNGHHFFSASKDRAIKYWDGDKFEQIQRLDGHFNEVWALAISRSGQFLVSAGHDKSIRVWRETDEQIFLEEEREREIEELYGSMAAGGGAGANGQDVDPEDVDAEGRPGEVGMASKQTDKTLNAGERIAEALELGIADLRLLQEWKEAQARSKTAIAPPQRHVVFVAQDNMRAEDYVLRVLQRIPAAELQDALLVLPFSQMPALLTFLNLFAQQGMNMELTSRVLFFVLKINHRQIVASRTMRATLEALRENVRRSLQQQKDMMGLNMAMLRTVRQLAEQKSEKTYLDDALDTTAVAARNVRKRAFGQTV